MFENYPAHKYWFKVTDNVRNVVWYTCRFCMCTAANSSKKINHHEHCTRPNVQSRDY